MTHPRPRSSSEPLEQPVFEPWMGTAQDGPIFDIGPCAYIEVLLASGVQARGCRGSFDWSPTAVDRVMGYRIIEDRPPPLLEPCSEMRFMGVDLGSRPSIGVEGVWYDGELVEVHPMSPDLVTRAKLPDLLEVRVPSDGLWVGEGEVEEQSDPPVRREPFPNPEAALWRPKAW